MSKNLHDIDDLFRSALEGHEETPSRGVKESLVSVLDREDAESYKRRFIGWKRTALLLFFLLAGVVLYESGILKKGSSSSAARTDEKQVDLPSGDGDKETYKNKPATDDIIADKSVSYNREGIKDKLNDPNKTETGDNVLISPDSKEITVTGTTGINNETSYEKSSSGNKIVVQKREPENGISNFPAGTQEEDAPGIMPNPAKNITVFLKINDAFVKETNMAKIAEGLTNSIRKLQAIKDSILKNYTTKSTKQKNVKFLKPIWMITPFASYERAGYRLDSDLPNNVTSIKHSEVHEPSFSLGILATRQIKKQWGIQTGLIYSQTDIGITPQKLYALQNPAGDISFKYITSSGYAYIKPGLGVTPAIGDSLITTEGKHRLKFISVPLIVKYSIGRNKLTFVPGIGIEANFLTSAKVETEVESPSNPEILFINKLDGAKSFHVSVVADAEFRYKLNNKLSVSFRPTIRFATSSITRNNVVETFPRSFGVGMGLTRKF